MNNTKAILKTLRLPNLIMLAVVQFIVSHFIVEIYSFQFYLLVTSSTILIALGGYLLNDIQDLEIDRFNNKLGWINDSNKKNATIIAISAHIFGLALGFYASYLSDLSLFPWFIVASMALVAYAYFFSKFKIIGNFLISGLIALAIHLCFKLEIANFSGIEYKMQNSFFDSTYIFIYASLGFLLNWVREVCKDLEDFEGDKKFKRYSLPIVLGKGVSKFFIGLVLLGLFLLMSLFLFMSLSVWLDERLTSFLIYAILYMILLIGSFIILAKAEEKKDYKRLSLALKILMFIGLFIPIFLF